MTSNHEWLYNYYTVVWIKDFFHESIVIVPYYFSFLQSIVSLLLLGHIGTLSYALFTST